MKLIASILCLTIQVNLFSQNVITGIGEIKLGKTYEQIVSDLQLKGIKEASKEVITTEDIVGNEVSMLFVYDTLAPEPSWETEDFYIKCPGGSTLIIPKLTVAGIEVNDISLHFYNNKLYQIITGSPSEEFIEAVKTKYGAGRLTKKEKTVRCTSPMAGNYEVKEVRYTTSFNPETHETLAVYLLSDYRDSKCKRQISSEFDILNIRTQKVVNAAKVAESKNAARRKAAKLKPKLNNF